MALKLKSLSTRGKAREIAREAERFGGEEIDLSDVEFISRSCADELVTQAEKRSLLITGATGNVEKMLKTVKEA